MTGRELGMIANTKMSEEKASMKRSQFLSWSSPALLAGLAFFGTGAFAAKVDVSYDHKNGSYHLGQQATFTVSVTDDAGKKLTNGCVNAMLDNFGTNVVFAETAFDLSKANPFKVSGRLPGPGYLRLRLKSADIENFPKNGGDWYAESVACGEGQLRPPVPCPDDFMSFWKNAQAAYDREMPGQPEMRLDEKMSEGAWNVWRFSLDVPGNRKLHGYVTKEKKAPAGRLPGRIQIAAAGFGGWSQLPIYESGNVCLAITVYPFEPDPETRKPDYDAMDAAAKKNWGVDRYCLAGVGGKREDYFFYPVILGSLRAIDWFASREDVDPMRIGYQGTSQGGGLGFAVTALSARIRRSVLFVPALTGHYGWKDGLQSGWPRIIDNMPDAAARANAERNAAYFDGVNFARFVKVPVRVIAGHSDNTCPPAMVRTAFNVIDCYDKAFEGGLRMTHGVYGHLYAKYLKWLGEF